MGDFDGHPFRGNQYTAGQVAEHMSKTGKNFEQTARELIHPSAVANEMAKTGQEYAEAAGSVLRRELKGAPVPFGVGSPKTTSGPRSDGTTVLKGDYKTGLKPGESGRIGGTRPAPSREDRYGAGKAYRDALRKAGR
jgi:hypothetical protein